MKKNNSYIIIRVALGFFLLFVVINIVFLGVQKGDYDKKNTEYLIDANTQRQMATMEHINSDFELLNAVAAGIVDNPPTSVEAAQKLLIDVVVTNHFTYMGLVGKDGIGFIVDDNGAINTDFDLFQYGLMREALIGKQVISPEVKSGEGKVTNYCAVPVKQDGVVTSVLFGANSEELLRDILAVPVYKGSGYFAIIDNEGTIMVRGLDPDPKVKVGANIFDISTSGSEELKAIKEGLDNNDTAEYSYSFNGQKQHITLQPLGINDWTMLSMMDQELLNANFNINLRVNTLMLALACGVFVLLLLAQLQAQGKVRKKLEYAAYTDVLTGTRNYEKFLIDAHFLLDQNPDTQYAVWSFDVINFSRINSFFGNKRGDDVLRRIASVLESTAPHGAIHCRVSGDLFAGICPYSNRRELKQWFQNIIKALNQRKVITREEMRIDNAMGIYCISDFDDVLTVAQMVNRASGARKNAKKRFGNNVEFYTQEMQNKELRDNDLIASAEQAIQKKEITFFLQPKVSIKKGNFHIAGAEALARWNHPIYGQIPPGEFIPLLEETGFITELDRALFRQACEWLARFKEEYHRPFRLAVNVSRQGLLEKNMVEYYVSVKDEFHFESGELELEFTESMLMSDADLFAQTILRLRENGFICSIDDFGSGYSSLNMLKSLPIDCIKLDGLFFKDNTRIGEIIVEHFISMAKDLCIETVAEGVESLDQIQILRKAGCDFVQGYIFFKPMPLAEFKEAIEQFDTLIDNDG